MSSRIFAALVVLGLVSLASSFTVTDLSNGAPFTQIWGQRAIYLEDPYKIWVPQNAMSVTVNITRVNTLTCASSVYAYITELRPNVVPCVTSDTGVDRVCKTADATESDGAGDLASYTHDSSAQGWAVGTYAYLSAYNDESLDGTADDTGCGYNISASVELCPAGHVGINGACHLLSNITADTAVVKSTNFSMTPYLVYAVQAPADGQVMTVEVNTTADIYVDVSSLGPQQHNRTTLLEETQSLPTALSMLTQFLDLGFTLLSLLPPLALILLIPSLRLASLHALLEPEDLAAMQLLSHSMLQLWLTKFSS
jgi:hypothetical protein